MFSYIFDKLHIIKSLLLVRKDPYYVLNQIVFNKKEFLLPYLIKKYHIHNKKYHTHLSVGYYFEYLCKNNRFDVIKKLYKCQSFQFNINDLTDAVFKNETPYNIFLPTLVHVDDSDIVICLLKLILKNTENKKYIFPLLREFIVHSKYDFNKNFALYYAVLTKDNEIIQLIIDKIKQPTIQNLESILNYDFFDLTYFFLFISKNFSHVLDKKIILRLANKCNIGALDLLKGHPDFHIIKESSSTYTLQWYYNNITEHNKKILNKNLQTTKITKKIII